MSRGEYTVGKRQREAEKARKKKEKLERRRRKREEGPNEVPIVAAEEMTGNLPTIAEAMRAVHDQAVAPKGAAPVPQRLFVGGLSWDTTREDLEAAFSKYGPVLDAVVVTDRESGRSRGFGFVTMESRKDAPRAIEALNDSELDGRHIVVNVATERGGR